MDIEKMIERMNNHLQSLAAYSDPELAHTLEDAATALSTLQAENEKLKDQLYDGEGVNLVNYWMQQAKTEENGHRTCQAENEKLRAELEQVKRERDAAVKDLNEFLSLDELCPIQCKWCKSENTNCDGKIPEWRGPQKED